MVEKVQALEDDRAYWQWDTTTTLEGGLTLWG